jgi:formate-dependent nitrite reductase membrane component NrfD
MPHEREMELIIRTQEQEGLRPRENARGVVVPKETGVPAPEVQALTRRDAAGSPTYYDVPMLKPPVWKWEIATYFFLGGLSAGAFLLARLAERFGGRKYRDVTRAGTLVAAASFAPCPALLIKDLGDPKRFHYMLRVFKPGSPMNFGAWVLTAYGAFLSAAAFREWYRGVGGEPEGPLARAADSAIGVVSDGAGVPTAILLAGYTGVLLSTSNTPLWARNPWIGPLFGASAVSTGAAATRLLLEAKRPIESGDIEDVEGTPCERSAEHPLERIEVSSKLAEAATLAGYLASAGILAAPLTKGEYAPHLWGGVVGAGLVASTVAEGVAKRYKKASPYLKLAGAALTLAGGFALRWAMVHAGHASAKDSKANREASRR